MKAYLFYRFRARVRPAPTGSILISTRSSRRNRVAEGTVRPLGRCRCILAWLVGAIVYESKPGPGVGGVRSRVGTDRSRSLSRSTTQKVSVKLSILRKPTELRWL